MKKRVFNLIILDESGSMNSIRSEAITSVNETFQTIRSAQRKYEDQEQYVSFVSFNSDKIKTVYDCVPVNDVKDLTDRDYLPDCCTPLYDAMGQSLTNLMRKVNDEDNVLVTIITDGYENSSSEYSGKAIRQLVSSLKGKGWVIVYIGAEHDVEKVAAELDIDNSLIFSRNSGSVKHMSSRLKCCMNRMFDSAYEDSALPVNGGFFDEDEK